MVKNNILTAAGIILSLALAISGWAITSMLIDMESDRLLSGTASFMVNIPAIELTYHEEEHNISFGLNEGEVVSILRNWEQMHYRRPHEPAPGQIDMYTAIISGRAGLVFLHELNLLPMEMMTFDRVVAFLSQNIPQGQPFLPLRYSYWTVTMINDDISINMIINAVTGQIWEIDMISSQWRALELVQPVGLHASRDEIINALSAFMAKLDTHPAGDMYGMLYTLDFDNNWNRAIYSYDAYTGRVERFLHPRVVLPSPSVYNEHYLHAGIANPWHQFYGEAVFSEEVVFSEDVLMVGQSIANGDARAEIATNGSIWIDGTDAMLHFNRLTIKLTTPPTGIYN